MVVVGGGWCIPRSRRCDVIPKSVLYCAWFVLWFSLFCNTIAHRRLQQWEGLVLVVVLVLLLLLLLSYVGIAKTPAPFCTARTADQKTTQPFQRKAHTSLSRSFRSMYSSSSSSMIKANGRAKRQLLVELAWRSLRQPPRLAQSQNSLPSVQPCKKIF